MRYFSYSLCLVVLSFNCFAAKTKYYRGSTDVSSYIDISNLYTQSITNVSIEPSDINLTLLPDQSGFEKEQVNLIIETDIPATLADIPDVNVTVPYQVELSANQAICINNNFSETLVDFSASQSTNPTFVTAGIQNVGSGSESHQFDGVGEAASVLVSDLAETYSSDSQQFKKNTHKINLDFLTLAEIAQAMPSKSAMNTECTGSLTFSVTIGL